MNWRLGLGGVDETWNWDEHGVMNVQNNETEQT
jgi:hypothetical protein